MNRVLRLTVLAGLILGAAQAASAQSHTFTFDSGTDEGWGAPFGADGDINFTITNVAGSNRMLVPNTNGFQEAGVSGGSGSFFNAMAAAAANPAGYEVAYDWYVDTTQVSNATFFQLGTFLNGGDGYYAQNFPGTGKEVELNGTQLTSGQVFSGTVTVPFTTYRNASNATLTPGLTFYRLGLIENSGTDAVIPVYFDNISVRPVPEPASLALFALGIPALMLRRRRSA